MKRGQGAIEFIASYAWAIILRRRRDEARAGRD